MCHERLGSRGFRAQGFGVCACVPSRREFASFIHGLGFGIGVRDPKP